ncbi:MAG: hypothetical protein PHX86_08570, partial [Caldisericia bacterium]|nr:hypothetical protein [Caldisericia bacterium]
TDASGVPQVLYQYDLRTSLFTSINANNIRNPFTSLGEEGAITDTFNLITYVKWMVYRGGVKIDNETISLKINTKNHWEEIEDPGQATRGSFYNVTCDCWNSEEGLSDRHKEDLREELKRKGMTDDDEIEAAIQAFEIGIDWCCRSESKSGLGGNIAIVGIEMKEDTIGGVGCMKMEETKNGIVWKVWDTRCEIYKP